MFPVFWFLNMTVHTYPGPIVHDKWVLVTTPWQDLRIRMEEQPPIRRVQRIFLKSSQGQPTRVGPPNWGLG